MEVSGQCRELGGLLLGPQDQTLGLRLDGGCLYVLWKHVGRGLWFEYSLNVSPKCSHVGDLVTSVAMLRGNRIFLKKGVLVSGPSE